MANAQPVRGWFDTPGRLGDRTLENQLKGLDWLLENCSGRTVLDIGCAEGLISIELAKSGALAVHGIEIVPEHVEVGNRLRGDLPVILEHADANTWRPVRKYDIVIALASLHKLKNPTEACAAFAAAASKMVVLRLPPEHAPTIIDDRSGRNPHYIGKTMERAGFDLLTSNYDGHFGEWVGTWLRR
jgi:SAM-dependent methyltransferase